jgi:class 3 adenylate cyclase/streptogramin lyase
MQRQPKNRILAAVLFTDMVDSTSIAEELGDKRWKVLVDRHHRIVRRDLKRFGGRELDTAGDGFFASFTEPASAISCACAIAEDVRELGVEIRAGVHAGECERIGSKLGGITVVVGARIMALGGAGDVLVSGTAAELARGAGFTLEDRGSRALKGVEGEWRVLAVTGLDGVPRQGPAPAAQASQRRAQIEVDPVRRRIRREVVIGGAALLVVAAALGWRLTRATLLGPPGPDTVARIASSGSGFDRVIPVGSGAYPDAIGFGHGTLWVADVKSRTLAAIDPTAGTSHLIGTPSTPTGVTFADGRVWVTYGFTSDKQHVLDTYDPGNDTLGPADVSLPAGSYPITSEGGAIWVADPIGSTVVRYDPIASRQTSYALTPDSAPDVIASAATDPSAVWVAAGGQPRLFRIDPAHPQDRPATFNTAGAILTAVAVAPDGSVWTVGDAGSFLVFSANGTTIAQGSLGDACGGPDAVLATNDAVWVSCSSSQVVARLDPADGHVIGTIPTAGSPGPMALDDSGGVWVTIRGA